MYFNCVKIFVYILEISGRSSQYVTFQVIFLGHVSRHYFATRKYFQEKAGNWTEDKTE